MRKFLFISFVFICLPITSIGQSISANHSIVAFGKSPGYVEIAFSHSDFSVHFFCNYRPDIISKNYFWITRNNLNSTPAISYSPIRIKYLEFGGILSLNRFPTRDGTFINFYVELEIPIKNFGINIKHISNGFGLLHKSNLGYDALGISYSF